MCHYFHLSSILQQKTTTTDTLGPKAVIKIVGGDLLRVVTHCGEPSASRLSITAAGLALKYIAHY